LAEFRDRLKKECLPKKMPNYFLDKIKQGQITQTSANAVAQANHASENSAAAFLANDTETQLRRGFP
jgi:hypothetical protein